LIVSNESTCYTNTEKQITQKIIKILDWNKLVAVAAGRKQKDGMLGNFLPKAKG